MRLVVADASALVDYLLGQSDKVAAVVTDRGTDLHAPALCDVEVVAALRRALRLGLIDEPRAAEALQDHLDLPLVRHGHEPLLGRMLELRENFSAYDAAYLALAERLGAALLTTDQRLARAARTVSRIPLL